MKVQIFSDIHHDLKALERCVSAAADLYISAGDLSNFGRGLAECGRILKPLGDKLLVMPGNHETAEENASFCAEFGFRNFHEATHEANGIHFAGLGYSNPTPFNTPGEYSEEQIDEKLAAFAALSPLVLVCHAPPLGTALDESGPGKHFGSRAVKEFIDKHQPRYFFCGHIHEAGGRSATLGNTQGWNVGKRGYLLEV